MPKRKKRPLAVQSKQRPQQNDAPVVVERTHIEARRYSGPLPSPEMLKQYNEIVPDAAGRILSTAEQQAKQRQALEKTVVVGDSKRADRGLWAGLAVTLSLVAGAVFLVSTGHDAAGVAIAALDVVGLASVFVYGTISRRSERSRKAALTDQVNRPRRS